MDEWYARLPERSRPEIRQRFCESTTGAHLGAFWEMYVHEAICRLDFEVDVAIGRDHKSRRPDLLVNGDPAGFFVEATVALGDDVIRRDQSTRADQLYAAVEQISNPNFLVYVMLERVGEDTPGRRLITAPLDRWLDTLDPDTERRRVDAGGPPVEKLIDRDGWRVRLQATAKLPEHRGRPGMGVISGREEGFTDDAGGEGLLAEVDDVAPLTRVLLKKAGHGYELEERQFMIAVLCAGALVDDQDIAQALFGRIEYTVSMSSDRAVGRYLPGGLWHEGAGPRYTNVSAVLTASNLNPGSVAAVEPCLWLNPAATHPIDAAALPWQRREFDARGRLVEHPARTRAADIFGLPPRWPAQ